jgi:CspA family cold shock protein
MAQGTIKKLINAKGFGFIGSDGGPDDVFFHTSAVENANFDELQEGQAVEFELVDGPKGPRAENIRVV